MVGPAPHAPGSPAPNDIIGLLFRRLINDLRGCRLLCQSPRDTRQDLADKQLESRPRDEGRGGEDQSRRARAFDSRGHTRLARGR
jgi:hypothetical protein